MVAMRPGRIYTGAWLGTWLGTCGCRYFACFVPCATRDRGIGPSGSAGLSSAKGSAGSPRRSDVWAWGARAVFADLSARPDVASAPRQHTLRQDTTGVQTDAGRSLEQLGELCAERII